MLICSYPKLFAACHVLHRLLMPRHPPCALFRLTSLYDLHHSAVLKKELCKSSLQNFEIVIVTLHMHFHARVVPQSFLLAFLSLCSFFSCSVFKVQPSFLSRAHSSAFRRKRCCQPSMHSKNGGPKWARTTDLTIISRTL